MYLLDFLCANEYLLKKIVLAFPNVDVDVAEYLDEQYVAKAEDHE